VRQYPLPAGGEVVSGIVGEGEGIEQGAAGLEVLAGGSMGAGRSGVYSSTPSTRRPA